MDSCKMEQEYYRISVGSDIFDIHKRYINLKPIGGGAYGIVCSADDTIFGKRVAIKKIKDVFTDLTDAKRILREIKLLRHLGQHDNIINILNIMTMPPNTQNFVDIYLVTDLMESDLERIISSTQPLTDAHFQYFLYQILRGIKYIHSAQVLHRDLKTSNLLVNSNCDLAICDFGLARGVEHKFNEELTEYVVTRWYRAPELLTECQNYGSAVDIWAIGCIFAEMLRRKPFFQGKDPAHQLYMVINVLGSPSEKEMAFVTHDAARRAILQNGYQPKRPFKAFFPGANPEAIDLLEKMLTFNPDDRITVDDALQHQYLSALHNPEDEPVCSAPFNFDFERDYIEKGIEIPKHELQRLMYIEMLALERQNYEQERSQHK